jgi:WD40 repeat protein
MWDVGVASKTALLHDFIAHEGAALCDAAFSRHQDNVIATVGDDRALHIWDLRGALGAQHRSSSVTDSAERDVLTVDWNHQREHLLATAGKDTQVRVWDLRTLREPYKVLPGHTGETVVVRWAPPNDGQSPNILASCSRDQTVIIWDLAVKDTGLAELENDPESEDEASVVPELLFQHRGHDAAVDDLCWNFMDRNLLCSVDGEGVLQIWQPQCSCDPPSLPCSSSAFDVEETASVPHEEPEGAESTATSPQRKRARITPTSVEPA